MMKFITEHWELILACWGTLELILRAIPTTKNWSILDKIHLILELFSPNKTVDNKRFTIGAKEDKGVLKRIFKKKS